MDWLKTILGKAVINDGVLDVNGVLESVKAEIPKHFVPKTDYNAKTEELKTAEATIKTLKNDNAGNETLQNTIKEHEGTITNLQKENDNMKKEYALKSALSESGCSDPGYIIYLQGGVEKFTFDKEGKPIDADNVAKTYKESHPQLFPTGQKKQTYIPPAGGAGGGVTNPFAKDTWNLTDQGQMLRDNPAQAREMAAAVGTMI